MNILVSRCKCPGRGAPRFSGRLCHSPADGLKKVRVGCETADNSQYADYFTLEISMISARLVPNWLSLRW